MNTLIIEPVDFESLDTFVANRIIAAVGGKPSSVLRFRNAIIAREEVNKNRDEITLEGLHELAASLALQPIDLYHHEKELCGMFLSGEVVKDHLGNALSASGLIYADRFPDTARGFD